MTPPYCCACAARAKRGAQSDCALLTGTSTRAIEVYVLAFYDDPTWSWDLRRVRNPDAQGAN